MKVSVCLQVFCEGFRGYQSLRNRLESVRVDPGVNQELGNHLF
jgi:hypothetical protein